MVSLRSVQNLIGEAKGLLYILVQEPSIEGHDPSNQDYQTHLLNAAELLKEVQDQLDEAEARA